MQKLTPAYRYGVSWACSSTESQTSLLVGVKLDSFLWSNDREATVSQTRGFLRTSQNILRPSTGAPLWRDELKEPGRAVLSPLRVCRVPSAHLKGDYTLVSRPFMSIVQWSLFFMCLGGIGGFFLSGGGRTPSSSCISRATSGGISSCLNPEEGGRKLPLLLRQFITGVVFMAGLVSQIKGTWAAKRVTGKKGDEDEIMQLVERRKVYILGLFFF